MKNKKENFYQKILEASQKIASQAKRGPANYVVVNQNLAKYFLPINLLRAERIEKILNHLKEQE
jgi:hypothetical protein